ncbi:hypothetical protein KAH94_04265 [bacterium]|nr:hypothetical protein [bacterium]
MKKTYVSILFGFLLLSSNFVQAGWGKSLFFSGISAASHFAGGLFTSIATIHLGRGIVLKSLDESEINLFMEEVPSIDKQSDSLLNIVSWFKSGNINDEALTVFNYMAIAIGFHSVGFLSSFIAGRASVKKQKMVNVVKKIKNVN